MVTSWTKQHKLERPIRNYILLFLSPSYPTVARATRRRRLFELGIRGFIDLLNQSYLNFYVQGKSPWVTADRYPGDYSWINNIANE